jgi:hypothetical protein
MGDEHQGDGRGAHEVQPEGDDKVGVQKSSKSLFLWKNT